MEQVKNIFKQHGLTLSIQKRRNGIKYVYAARFRGGKTINRYIGSLKQVEQMSEEDILKKIA